MERITASSLSPELPDDLAALRFQSRPAAGATLRLLAVGDVGFSGRLACRVNEPLGPFEQLAPLLASADLVFGNLETPLVDNKPGALFAAPPGSASLLARAGFDLLNLANNHVADYGQDGIASTLRALQAEGLRSIGAGDNGDDARTLVVTELAAPDRSPTLGLRLGWLAAARTLQPQPESGPAFWELDRNEILRAVERYRAEVDRLIISLHLGYMYVDYPHPEHRQLGLDLAAAGADLVLMHHAHMLQGVELAPGGGVVCYNLGNCLFDWQEGAVDSRMLTAEQRQSAAFVFDFDADGLATAAALPFVIDDDLDLVWARGESGEAILDRLERISDDLAGDWIPKFQRQRGERNTGLGLKTLGAHLKRGELRALARLLTRARPRHLSMIGRWLVSRDYRRKDRDPRHDKGRFEA